MSGADTKKLWKELTALPAPSTVPRLQCTNDARMTPGERAWCVEVR